VYFTRAGLTEADVTSSAQATRFIFGPIITNIGLLSDLFAGFLRFCYGLALQFVNALDIALDADGFCADVKHCLLSAVKAFRHTLKQNFHTAVEPRSTGFTPALWPDSPSGDYFPAVYSFALPGFSVMGCLGRSISHATQTALEPTWSIVSAPQKM